MLWYCVDIALIVPCMQKTENNDHACTESCLEKHPSWGR